MKSSSFLVSVIITTYNRYDRLLEAIDSVYNQTYDNLEIIVVNDKSTHANYYEKRPENVIWIDLEKSSREVFGYPAVGFTRNVGIKGASGEYIAFLDDDDFWLPEKLAKQMSAMITNGYQFSCTEAYMFNDKYVIGKNYPILHQEYFRDFCKNFFEKYYDGWKGKLPGIFNIELIKRHNFIIHSSVIVSKSLLQDVGLYKENNPQHTRDPEDWELWRRLLLRTDCLSITEPLIFYFVKDTKLSYDQILKIKFNRLFKFVFRSTTE